MVLVLAGKMKKYKIDQATREYLIEKIARIEEEQRFIVERMKALYLVDCNYDDTDVSMAITECEKLICDAYHNSLFSNMDIERIWRGHLPEELKRPGGAVRH